MFRPPRGSYLEARALYSVYLEKIDHGIYRLLVYSDGMYKVIEWRHVTFGQTRFLRAKNLKAIMQDEASLNDIVSEPNVAYSSKHSGTDDEISIDNFAENEMTENENQNNGIPKVNDDDDEIESNNEE